MRLPTALLALALLATPTLAQDSGSGYAGEGVEMVLYGHIYDFLETVPMNTQPMDPSVPDLARGFTQPTVAPNYGAKFNRISFFNTMGPVSYNVSLAQPRIHPEKGLALDLELDTSRDILVYWYMSADALEVRQQSFEPPVHAGAVPQLTVRAEVRLGNDVRKDLGAGNLVAGGQRTVDVLTAPGQPEVMEIVVNLGKAQMDVIPRLESFNLGVEWFQLEGSSGEQVLMPGWNLHTGAQYPNRLVLPVKNPIYIYFVEPQFVDDKLAVNAALNSPLGNYDVDLLSLRAEITGPGGFAAKTVSEPVLIQHSFQHNEHHVATINTWVWDYKADAAPPGNYSVTVRGTNLQGTALAEKTARFSIEAEGSGTAVDSEGEEVVTEAQLQQRPQERRSPGFEALALVGVAALALLGRGRQGS